MSHWVVCVKLDKETIAEVDVKYDANVRITHNDRSVELYTESYAGTRTCVFSVNPDHFIYAKKES